MWRWVADRGVGEVFLPAGCACAFTRVPLLLQAESVGCATALLEMKTWLHETPPHLWVHLPFGLPVAPVPASRDVPFVVMTFGFVVTCVTIACFAARYYTHQFLMSNHAAAKKKNE